MTTLDDLSLLRETPFAQATMKLEELITQSGRAFLIGAGCSKCAGLPLTVGLTDKTLQSPTLDPNAKKVLEGLKAEFDGSADANIEDYLSELIDLLAIAERREARGAKNEQVNIGGRPYASADLREATENIKSVIAGVIDCEVTIDTHRRFIKAVHRPLRPGRSILDQPVHYLVLNYDTLIEDALALERIPFSDGLDGGVTGWWNPSMFDRDGLSARVLKLHGSINWCEFQDDSLPRRVAKRLNTHPVGDRRILIWPASTKYRETQRDPYAQLADRARRALLPGIGSQRVLIVCGYRFGDSHINLEVDGALRQSEGRLTVIVFTSHDQPIGQLKLWTEDLSVRDQVLVFGKRGFFHGELREHSTADLPWWKFENVTRLLEGER